MRRKLLIWMTADTVKKLDMLAPLVARNLDRQIPQSL